MKSKENGKPFIAASYNFDLKATNMILPDDSFQKLLNILGDYKGKYKKDAKDLKSILELIKLSAAYKMINDNKGIENVGSDSVWN
jgi:hypothetical protein